MSIINWEVYQKVKKKKRLTYSKELVSIEDYSVWGRIKKFFKRLFSKYFITYLYTVLRPPAVFGCRLVY